LIVEVLKCLKKYGQRLDVEIAQEMEMPLASVRERLSGLTASGEVITCRLTRFESGKKVDAWQCRLSGFMPSPAPGRKPKTAA